MKKILLLLKGMAMGGADVIPGVSGGTIALITGIYEELINSIRSIDGASFKMILKGQWKDFWLKINGAFLVNVFLGVLISIFSLARLITYLMDNEPIALWSFFFGLILISAFYVFPKERTPSAYIFLVIGVITAYLITTLTPANTPESTWFIFLSGAIAICAMILPGISGSFILLILGKYEYVMEAVKSFDIEVIVIFASGCVIGIISFSKLIHWLLTRYRSVTLATLSGFMLGSLNKIWPWKEEVGERFRNLSPIQFAEVTGDPHELVPAILFFVVGILLLVCLEWVGKKFAK